MKSFLVIRLEKEDLDKLRVLAEKKDHSVSVEASEAIRRDLMPAKSIKKVKRRKLK